MRVRRTAWTRFFPRFRSQAPCISVGNIAWGGTGKTPLVDWLLDWSEARDIHPVVLTRGYRAEAGILPARVGYHHTAHDVGDEPYMLFLEHPDADIMVDPVRTRSGRYAERALSPGVFILDDGFQHLAVDRDLDLVVLRPEDLGEDWNRVLPGGCWREPGSALRAADAFCIKADQACFAALKPVLEERLGHLHRPVFRFELAPQALVDPEGRLAPLEPDEPYVLVVGVGKPDQVVQTVTNYIGYAPKELIIKPDHYRYTLRDARVLKQLGITVVCTAKDGAKFRHVRVPGVRILRVKPRFGEALWTTLGFEAWLDAWWAQVVSLDPATRHLLTPLGPAGEDAVSDADAVICSPGDSTEHDGPDTPIAPDQPDAPDASDDQHGQEALVVADGLASGNALGPENADPALPLCSDSQTPALPESGQPSLAVPLPGPTPSGHTDSAAPFLFAPLSAASSQGDLSCVTPETPAPGQIKPDAPPAPESRKLHGPASSSPDGLLPLP